jgi:hypothetical protein
MSVTVARRYERALRWYPRAWRAENSEVVLATLLDVADADGRSRALSREVTHLALAGLIARVNGVVSWRARRSIASIFLGMGSALSFILFLFHTWSPWTPPPSAWTFYSGLYVQSGPIGSAQTLNASVLVQSMWIIALIFACLRHGRTARTVLLVAAMLPPFLTILSKYSGADWYQVTGSTSVILTLLALLSLGGTLNPRTVALSATVTTILLFLVEVQTGFPARGFHSDRNLWQEAASIGNVAPVLVTSALVVILLLVYKLREIASVLIALSIPFACILVLDILRGNQWDGSGTPVLFGTVILALLSGTYILQRRKRSFPVPSADSTKQSLGKINS